MIMTQLELIRVIGDMITIVDVLRSNFGREDSNRKMLDNIRDELDTFQRKLVRNGINDTTQQFQACSESLKKINADVKKTSDDINQAAATLENLVKFVEVIQQIINVKPSP
jgi:deoxyribose-phosphate aldolase